MGPAYAAVRRSTVQLLKMKPGERLLISGVGTGLDLPLIGAGVEVIGADISAEMLQQARKKPSQANVQLIQMDAQCLDLPAESFDAVLLNLIVSVAPSGHAVFQEAWRMLKPGGRLVLFDKFAPENRSIGVLRKAVGGLFRLIGTDVNRKLSDVVGNLENGVVEINEPSIFFGQYRILKFRKVQS
jgi:ubiquinone/menaquinone biosynthesis C-methylase UbiE